MMLGQLLGQFDLSLNSNSCHLLSLSLGKEWLP